jgi:hypothetical protein
MTCRLTRLMRIITAEAEAKSEAERAVCQLFRPDAEREANRQPSFLMKSQKED